MNFSPCPMLPLCLYYNTDNYAAVPHLRPFRPSHVQEVLESLLALRLPDSEAATNEPGVHPESTLT